MTTNIAFTRSMRATAGALLVLTAFAAGCEDDESGPHVTPIDAASGAGGLGGGGVGGQAGQPGMPDGGSDAAGGAGQADASADDKGPPATPPLYAVMSAVFSDSGPTSYLSLLPSLDIKEVDHSKAREYPGRIALAAYNGWLFVNDAQSPTITRFSVTAEGALKEDGKVNFGNYGLKVADIGTWGNTFISPTKAYLFNSNEGNTLIWNATKMEITGEIKTPELVRAGLALGGSPGVLRGNRLFRVFHWSDWKAYTFSSEDQLLGVYDVENDKLIGLVKETRCPAMSNRVSKDEQGNLYFSNWVWTTTATLVKGAPKNCALRIGPSSDRFDPNWILPFASVTGGREAAVFTHIGDGTGLLDVFHHERATIDANTDPAKLAGSTNWRIWRIDIEKGSGAPLEEIDWLFGSYTPVQVDGHSFVIATGKDYAITHYYEIKDGRAVLRFNVRGHANQFVKVR